MQQVCIMSTICFKLEVSLVPASFLTIKNASSGLPTRPTTRNFHKLLTVDIIRRERLRKHKSRLNRLHKCPVAASVTDNFSLSGLLGGDENFDDEWTIGGEQFPQQMLMDDPVGHDLTALDSTASDPPVAIHPPVALHHSPVALDYPLTIPFSGVESPMPKDLPVPKDLHTASDPPVAFPPPVALPHSPVALDYPLTIPFSVVESPMPKDLPVAIDFPVPLDSPVALDLPVVANFLIPDTSLLGSRVAQIFDNELWYSIIVVNRVQPFTVVVEYSRFDSSKI
jgi:hypothetical protein